MNDSRRRVVCTELLAFHRIIFLQEVFVEVNDRIGGGLLRAPEVLLVDLLHKGTDIRIAEYLTKIVHNRSKTVVEVRSCDVVEEATQKRIGMRDKVTCLCAAEVLR